MTEPSLPPPPFGDASKRPLIDRAPFAQAVAGQKRQDAKSPPVSVLTKMDAVRMARELILRRKDLKWTDAMIAAWLRELGVEISRATLCVYRSRLAREGTTQIGSLETSPPETTTPPADTISTDSETPEPSASPSRQPIAAATSAAAQPVDEAAAPLPKFNPAVDFDDRV